MNVPYLARRYGGLEPKRLGLAHPSIAPYGVFHASDGDILVGIQNEREWKVFCEGFLDNSDFAIDLRFASNSERVRNRDVLDRTIQAIVERHTVEDLCRLLDRLRIAYGRVASIDDLIGHRSAVTARVESPGGPVELLAPPVIVDGQRAVLRPVPMLGDHDEALRAEFASRQEFSDACGRED